MLLVLLCAALTAGDPVPAAAPTAEQAAFFEKGVRPLLVEHCQKCHGEKKQWGGLRLDSRAAILKGGDTGPALVPGKPEESLLIRAVRHVDDDLKMPQDAKLADTQIATLVRWVELGAPFPDTQPAGKTLRDPEHWAFQPPADPPVPDAGDSAWPRNDVDHFILDKLTRAEIAPAPAADKRTLIRRVTFDLTGLPPTPEEIAAFLADESPEAFARVVDRLLATPAYGERWGRHWLDVVRYADSNGLDENVAHGNAWRYRDYVVSAFNSDLPFDQFVVEQLAGDLLPADTEAQRHARLVATGFLSIGPKVLAETDEAKMRMDIVDEQLDTFGKTFLGLTLGCARCHDHKFDPIAAADYYALAGIFKSTKSMRKYTKVAEWHENVLESAAAAKLQADYDARLAAQHQALAEFITAADAAARAKLNGAQAPEKLEPLYPEETKAGLKKLRDELAALQQTKPELPSAMGVTEDAVLDVAIHIRGNPLKLGDVVPRRPPPAIRGPQLPQFTSQASGRRELAEWMVDPRHPLTARVFVNRVWRWHFGTGLVRSTDNFGLLGEQPSHPELLDWLALRFIADGWSVKALHRRILLSSVWQQSSVCPSETAERDPENRFFSRAELRRLEAEAVRDALLAVCGGLDPTVGGSLLTLKNRAYFFDHTSKDLTTYDSRRRSLYLPVVRNNVFDMFQLLDFPDPAVAGGDRASTVVAPQALLMMNSDFVMHCADDLADSVLAVPAAERLPRLYALVYGRAPTEDERRADAAFLAEADPDVRRAWSLLCHVLLAANEFIYVR